MDKKDECMATQEFYRCEICGNIIVKLEDSGMKPYCCGRVMTLMEPGTVDASLEAHVPVWKMEGNKLIVTVGCKDHPMTESHQIKWIFIKTNKGSYTIFLTPKDRPEACIKLGHCERLCAVYSYCNLHGLWKADIDEEEDCL